MKFKKAVLLATTAIFVAYFGFVFATGNVEKISLILLTRTLQKGKYVSVKGEVFYKVVGGKMVTHVTYPFEQVVITDASGEMKTYDFAQNAISIEHADEYSSRNSFFYNFFEGNITDMGLPQLNFKLVSNKAEPPLLISEWQPKTLMNKGLQKIIVAHQNNLPVYMGFYNEKKMALQKIYYTNYQPVGNMMLPFNITEINYENNGKDSIITRRTYSDLKTNGEVSNKYFEFQIPSSAKLIEMPK